VNENASLPFAFGLLSTIEAALGEVADGRCRPRWRGVTRVRIPLDKPIPRADARNEGTSARTPECLRVTSVYRLGKPAPRFAAISVKPSDGLEPSIPSLPSSNDARSAGTAGKPRARKPRKKKESAEDE
jgi:hypothetical protein